MGASEVTLSVVSHGQNNLVNHLIADISAHCNPLPRLVVTQNVADPVPLEVSETAAEILINSRPKGFGANHNAAFTRCRTPYFCIANPDIRLTNDPFGALANALRTSGAAVAGPLVRGPKGNVEDSARRFPTMISLVDKLLRGSAGPEYRFDQGMVSVDWIAGMFMLFETAAYRDLGGFDERYFLYYEDVDICRRLNRSGRKVAYEPQAQVVHAAQRASRRDLWHLRRHLASLLRYLLSR
jgi:GT2 family glycosyltransferase